MVKLWRTVVSAIGFALLTTPAFANTALICSFDGFSGEFEVSIDFDRGVLIHGDESVGTWFPIVQLDANRITAIGRGGVSTGGRLFEPREHHGGSVYVIDRKTGEIVYASVGDCAATQCPNRITDNSQRGSCKTKLF